MKANDLERLFDEVRLLWHAMVRAGGRLHAREPVTLSMRAVLEALLREGPSSVPTIARRRHVTRQHVQALVNALLERRLVALAPNPAHRRSSLVALTKDGEGTIRRMKERETRYLGSLETRVSGLGLERAAAVLRAVRQSMTEET